jgi:beta-lactamase class A
MITESDNTATNMLIRLVGRQSINATMAQLGLHGTVVGDYIRSDGDIRALRTSPADMAYLLQQIALEHVVDAWSCREMIAIMSGQRHNDLLPQPLPRGLQIAHKTGTLHDTLNDVGIVYLGSQPYVIAVMTTHLPDLDAGRRFIRSISRLAYDAFARIAQARVPNSELSSATSTTTGIPADSAGRGSVPPDLEMWTPQGGRTGPAGSPG